MYSYLYKICAWLVQKLTGVLVIVVLGLAAWALWLFLQETVDLDSSRLARMAQIATERDRLVALRTELAGRIEEIQAEIAEQEDRARRAARIVATLRSLESWWDRLFGDTEQQKANAEQIERMEKLQTDSRSRIADLRMLIVQTNWERDGAALALAQAERELVDVERSQSQVAHYLREAWVQSKWVLVAALASFLFGPSLMKLLLYYGLAPVMARTRAIRFSDEQPTPPDVGDSRVSIEAALWPGELLHVKEKYLQASDEGLSKKTRFVLNWKYPLTSLACGLAELVEMRNGTATGAGRVTFSNAHDPHAELAVIGVPEGSSLILRPSFLAGVITRGDQPLRIRSRWQLFRWQAWITLQFRFFEFFGPCRLLVTGSRGIRAERLLARDGLAMPARRTNQEATIGFTPNLEYRPIRAETFWGYFRGMNPLFDDLFAGTGLFLVQETAAGGEGEKSARFWSAVWQGVLRVFGL